MAVGGGSCSVNVTLWIYWNSLCCKWRDTHRLTHTLKMLLAVFYESRCLPDRYGAACCESLGQLLQAGWPHKRIHSSVCWGVSVWFSSRPTHSHTLTRSIRCHVSKSIYINQGKSPISLITAPCLLEDFSHVRVSQLSPVSLHIPLK